MYGGYSLFLFFSLILMIYSFYSFLMVLLSVELLMLIVYVDFCIKMQCVGWLTDLMFMFICMMVLEGVMGLCLLIKTYRYDGSNLFVSW